MKVGQVIDVTNSQTELLKTLAFRSIDIEARSRRNNLIFRGLPEKIGENCFDLIFELLESSLAMNTSDIYISRAHRLGAKNPNRQIQSRPIIVCFRDFCDTENIMGRARMLKDTPYSVDVDLPREIQQARSRLWPRFKKCKQENPRSKVTIVYPAKLIMDHRLIHDEMPEWGRYMRNDRLLEIEHIDRQQQTRPGSPMNQKSGQETMDGIVFPPPPTYSMVTSIRQNDLPNIGGQACLVPVQHPQHSSQLPPINQSQLPPFSSTQLPLVNQAQCPLQQRNYYHGSQVLTFSILSCWAFFRDSVFIYFMVTSVLFVPCGGCKKSPRTFNQ
jgi:hypothetical protein